MMRAHAWLPDLVLLNDYGGNWHAYIEGVYELFKQDFIHSQPVWPGRRWALKRMPMSEGKEATFWHIVQEGKDERNRSTDLRRCERIRWPRPIVDTAHKGALRLWRNRRGSDHRILIALEDFSYLVVLADREDHILLWTAYPVERKHRRDKLRKEWKQYEQNQKG